MSFEFQIQTKGNNGTLLDSSLSEIASLRKLDTPSNLRTGDLQITWDTVAGADLYLIGGDIPADETRRNSYNLLPGTYNISVAAASDSKGICDSDPVSAEVTIEKKLLGKLQGVSVKDGKLVWEPLENAAGYKIFIEKSKTILKEITANATGNFADLLSLGLEDGTYTISIFAIGNEVHTDSEKEYVSYKKETAAPALPALAQIKNAIITQGVLKWNAVSSANGYVVNIVSGVHVRNINIVKDGHLEVDIPALNLEAGKYTVALYALGGEKYGNSPTVSLSYTAIKLESPKNLAYNGTRLTWSPVNRADNYRVTVGNVQAVTVTSASYDIERLPGQYSITVQAVSETREVQNSQPSVFNHTQPKRALDNITNVLVDYGVLKWNSLEHASGYVVAIRDSYGSTLHTYEKAAGNDAEVDLYAANLPLGDYTLSVKAIGDAVYSDSAAVSLAYSEKMIRDIEVRGNFNYGGKYPDSSDYWIQHFLNFSLKQGLTFDNLNVEPEQWNAVYENFLSGAASENAAAIGNDIIVTYYYKNEAGENVVLLTTWDSPLVKNKLWGSWLWHYSGSTYSLIQGDIIAPFSIGGVVPAETRLQVSANIGRKNPVSGGTAISSPQLSEIAGRMLHVDVDVIFKNGDEVHFYKETAALEIPGF